MTHFPHHPRLNKRLPKGTGKTIGIVALRALHEVNDGIERVIVLGQQVAGRLVDVSRRLRAS